MADFFKRLGNVIKGATSEWISDVESDNPRAVVHAAVRGAEERYQEATSNLAGLKVRRDKIAAERGRIGRELEELTQQRAGLDTIDPALAASIDSAMAGLSGRLTALDEEDAGLAASMDSLQQSLPELRRSIDRIKQEADQLVAAKMTAQQEIDAQALASGTATRASDRALQNVRERVDRLSAMVGTPLASSDGPPPVPSADTLSRLKAQARLAQLKAGKAGAPQAPPAESAPTPPPPAAASGGAPLAADPVAGEDPLPRRRL